MAISFESIGQKLVSFKAASGLAVGDVCIVSANDTVAAASANGEFCGVVSGIRAGVAGVILGGCVTVPYTGETAPSVGYCALAADGDKGVTVKTGATSRLVVNVDTTNETVTFFLN